MKISSDALHDVKLKKATAPPSNVFQQLQGSSTLSTATAAHAQYNDNPEQEAQTREYFFSSGMDEWCDEHMKGYTFPTASTPLTTDEAREILLAYDILQQKRISNPQDEITLETVVLPNSLRDLVTRVQDVMDQSFPGSPSEGTTQKQFFVKLSTRSPKDSPLIFHRAKVAYQQHIQGKELNENERWILLTEEVAKASAVTNAEDAIKILIDSERVFEDLKYALEDVTKWKVSVVVRVWDSRVTLASEFRAFCWNKRLTCIGQYFHPLYFPELHPYREQIVSDCLRLFDEIKEILPVPNALVDFAWMGPGEVLLIEINPLSDCLGSFSASTGLFDYDVDKALIQGWDKDAKCEIRLREGPEDSMKLKVKSRPEWRQVVYGKHP